MPHTDPTITAQIEIFACCDEQVELVVINCGRRYLGLVFADSKEVWYPLAGRIV